MLMSRSEAFRQSSCSYPYTPTWTYENSLCPLTFSLFCCFILFQINSPFGGLQVFFFQDEVFSWFVHCFCKTSFDFYTSFFSFLRKFQTELVLCNDVPMIFFDFYWFSVMFLCFSNVSSVSIWFVFKFVSMIFGIRSMICREGFSKKFKFPKPPLKDTTRKLPNKSLQTACPSEISQTKAWKRQLPS